MNKGQYYSSLSRARRFLKSIGLIKKNNERTGKPISEEFINICHNGKYRDIYLTGIIKRDFDILLYDESFFQFDFDNGNDYRCSYYQFPFDILPYGQWIKSRAHVDNYYNQEEYSQLVYEAELIENPVVIRYDYSIREYTPGIHPASHIHIGHQTDIRIPANMEINPYQFIMFVIKNVYYRIWKNIITRNSKIVKNLTQIKSTCLDINPTYFCTLDQCELYLT